VTRRSSTTAEVITTRPFAAGTKLAMARRTRLVRPQRAGREAQCSQPRKSALVTPLSTSLRVVGVHFTKAELVPTVPLELRGDTFRVVGALGAKLREFDDETALGGCVNKAGPPPLLTCKSRLFLAFFFGPGNIVPRMG